MGSWVPSWSHAAKLVGQILKFKILTPFGSHFSTLLHNMLDLGAQKQGSENKKTTTQEKKKADVVHKEIEELMKKITEVKGQIRSLVKERKSWVTDHNKSVRGQLKTPHDDESLADSLVDNLLKHGTLEFGGTIGKDSDGRTVENRPKIMSRKKSITTVRGRRSSTKKE